MNIYFIFGQVTIHSICWLAQGKGGDALSTELAVALRHCLLGGKRAIYLFFIYVISDCKNCLWRQVQSRYFVSGAGIDL